MGRLAAQTLVLPHFVLLVLLQCDFLYYRFPQSVRWSLPSLLPSTAMFLPFCGNHEMFVGPIFILKPRISISFLCRL